MSLKHLRRFRKRRPGVFRAHREAAKLLDGIAVTKIFGPLGTQQTGGAHPSAGTAPTADETAEQEPIAA